jgi:hypothetical protein
MHKAPTYIGTLFPSNPSDTDVKSYVINSAKAVQIRNRLHNDAISYIYSATITMGDAVRGIKQNLFTWATVKLYYVTFYSCRALLALDDICIFYVGTKPFSLEVRSGNSPQKKKGQTHKIVLNEFKNQSVMPRLISQDIEYVPPLQWLMTKREEANYKVAKFQEPEIPEHFQKIADIGIKQALTTYIQDSSDIYLFDADHAIVAYPLKTLQNAYGKMKTFGNLNLTDREKSYLCSLFKDNHGPIPEIHTMIRD